MNSIHLNDVCVSFEGMTPFTTRSHKLALVIGINEYPVNSKLRYCVNDADDVAKQLKSINFDVTKVIDCDYETFKQRINRFVQTIKPNNLVLFYFAGHGYEIERENYLLPANYTFHYETDERKYIKENSINVQTILSKIGDQNPNSIIMILDCCRSYVKARAMNTATDGLAPIKGPSESLIAFSCGSNQAALDNTLNSRNGIFTEFLLKYLRASDQDIDTVLMNVGKDMKLEGYNLPWRSSCLTEKVYLTEQIRSYKNNGLIIAGHNQQGNGLHQLSFPSGLCVDDARTIYITEWNNHRVVAWKYGSTSGQVVAGGNGSGNKMNQLNFPTDIIIDKNKTHLIICDHGNKRVVRWPLNGGRVGEILIPNIACNGLAMDNQGFLYVSDIAQSCIIRWNKNIDESSRTIVAGGNGKGSNLNQLNDPYYVFVDHNNSIYISDNKNHRVVKWDANAKQGVIVAGGQGQGKLSTQLSDPLGVIVDQCGAIYVADAGNSRIMRWCNGDRQGSIIIGENQQDKPLRRPNGLSFDQYNSLYVVEEFNHQVQRFDIVSKQ